MPTFAPPSCPLIDEEIIDAGAESTPAAPPATATAPTPSSAAGAAPLPLQDVNALLAPYAVGDRVMVATSQGDVPAVVHGYYYPTQLPYLRAFGGPRRGLIARRILRHATDEDLTRFAVSQRDVADAQARAQEHNASHVGQVPNVGVNILTNANANTDAQGVPNAGAEIRALIPTFDVNERFQFIEDMVDMVVTRRTRAFILTGSGGLGKSYTVLQTLQKHDMSEQNRDYKLIKGYSTARALYETMWNFRDKLLVFDDCDSVLEDRTSLNLLKGALDSTSTAAGAEGLRVASGRVSWGSAANSDIPDSFDFTGQIIFISNKMLTDIPQPILSRALFVDVTMTQAEKLARLQHLLPRLKPELGANGEQVKRDVMAFMTRLAPAITELSIRTFNNVCDMATGVPHNWERLASYQLTASMTRAR